MELKFSKALGTIVQYKESHSNQIYKAVDFGKPNSDEKETTLSVPQLEKLAQPISKEKKEDLMDLLKYIDPYFHRFYEELFGEATQNEEDPDI